MKYFTVKMFYRRQFEFLDCARSLKVEWRIGASERTSGFYGSPVRFITRTITEVSGGREHPRTSV